MLPIEDLLLEVLKLFDNRYTIRDSLRIVCDRFRVRSEREVLKAKALEIIKNLEPIDRIIEIASNGALLESTSRNILRIFVNEILKGEDFQRVRERAEKLARRKLGSSRAGDIVEILARAKEIRLDELIERDSLLELSIKYSHPRWFIEELMRFMDRDEVVKLLERNNQPPNIWGRVNTLRTSRERVIRELERDGISVIEDEDLPDVVLIVEQKIPIARTEAYRAGRIVLQDKSSCSVAHALKPEPGDFVIDLCASFGYITTHVAQLMENEGRILAIDRNANRLRDLLRLCRRLGIDIVETKEMDARRYSGYRADKIVLVPPCSSTGLFQMHPELRWWIKKDKLPDYVKVQSELLEVGERVLEDGGRIVYFTKSILPYENEDRVRESVSRGSLEIVDCGITFGSPGLEKFEDREFDFSKYVRRFYPHRDGTAGGFLALMELRA